MCVCCCEASSQSSSIWSHGALTKEVMVLMMQCSRYRRIAHITQRYGLSVKQEWFPAYTKFHSISLQKPNYSGNSGHVCECVFVRTAIKVGLADRYFLPFSTICVWTFLSCQRLFLWLILSVCIYINIWVYASLAVCLSFLFTPLLSVKHCEVNTLFS